MSTVTIPSTCQCGSIGRTDLRQCPEHWHIWRGDVRLTSVGRIVATSFPLDSSIPPAVLENAKERGAEVDRLFGQYVMGKLERIPAGTRTDSRDLLLKLIRWFEKQKELNIGQVEPQVLLGGEDHGGVVDFMFDGVPVDLKCTYNVEVSARMQIAGYEALSRKAGYILHVTERNAAARLIPLADQDRDDWQIVLEHWRMLRRRGKFDISGQDADT